MRIDITGYVTERFRNYSFKIRVTGDSVPDLSFSNIQVSKEVRIEIPPELYPFNDKFIELSGWDDPRRDKRNKCLAFVKALREGDQIECSVFIVNPKTRAIKNDRRDIETYAADCDLWLYPDNDYFRRSESDSRESLKFRKKWFYTCMNRDKCEKITGYSINKYRHKWWINKNSKMLFSIFWWIWIKTKVSKLWERFTGQGKNKSTTINTIVTVIAIVVAIIGIVVAIWFR